MSQEVTRIAPEKLTLLEYAHARRMKLTSYLHPFSWPEVAFSRNTSVEQRKGLKINRRLAYQYLRAAGVSRYEAKRTTITIDASQRQIQDRQTQQEGVIGSSPEKRKKLHYLVQTVKNWATSPERGDVAERQSVITGQHPEHHDEVLETRTVRRRLLPPMMTFGPKKNKIHFDVIGNPTQEQLNQKMDRAFVNLGYNLFSINWKRWATLAPITTSVAIGAKILLYPYVAPLLSTVGGVTLPVWGVPVAVGLGTVYLGRKFALNMLLGRAIGETTDRVRGKLGRLQRRYNKYSRFVAAQPHRPFILQ